MTKYFRIEEITEDEFEETTGVSQDFACQTIDRVDGVVFVAIETYEEEMIIPMDMFEG